MFRTGWPPFVSHWMYHGHQCWMPVLDVFKKELATKFRQLDPPIYYYRPSSKLTFFLLPLNTKAKAPCPRRSLWLNSKLLTLNIWMAELAAGGVRVISSTATEQKATARGAQVRTREVKTSYCLVKINVQSKNAQQFFLPCGFSWGAKWPLAASHTRSDFT